MAVITATLSGARGRIAIAIGPFYDGLAGGGTSISGALSFASRLLQMSGLKADRQVIDVSGDGVNNCGAPVAPIRDAVIAQGATINGLAISPLQGAADGNTDSFGQPTLEWYYKSRVIGGPRAFVITVGDRADIENAIQRKLVLEIAGAPSRIQFTAESLCLPGVASRQGDLRAARGSAGSQLWNAVQSMAAGNLSRVSTGRGRFHPFG